MPKYIMGHRAARRSDTIRSVLLVGLLVTVAAVLQTTLLGRIRPFGIIPDLTMITVVAIAYFCGRETGAVTGIAGGFLIEAMGGGRVIVLPLVYLILCYTIGHYARAVIPKRFDVYMLMQGIAIVVRSGVTLLLACLQYSRFSLPHLLLYSTLPEILVTAAIGCALFIPLRLFCSILDRRRRIL